MKRFIIPILDIIIGIYVIFAMTSFNTPKETYPVCTQVNINIADESTFGFLNAEEIKKILQQKKLYPLNKPMASVSPRIIEETLRVSAFVNTAECYKTNDGHVQITITQRSPVLRIKNNRGEDYYIDEKGGVMPNSSYTSDLIIATGDIDRKFAQQYLVIVVNTIMADNLWRNQIEQINVLPDHGIEIIPRVGDHVVFMGYLPESNSASTRAKAVSSYVTKQLGRLDKFYRYGLSKAGWNRYENIDLQFVNQIICRKKGAELARLQAEKNAKEAEERQREAEAAQQQQERAIAAGVAAPEPQKQEQKKAEAKKPEPKKTETKKPETKKADNKEKTKKK